MSWLLELLLDGIGEICSQFAIDMMELVTEMFTELLSCNLSLFEELFSVVSALYANVIVPMGIAILLLILVWQLFKSMFGKSVSSEEPIELLIRSAIALFFVVAAKPIVNYILKIAGTPYQWVVGTEIKVQSFAGFVSALEGVTEALGIGNLSISLLMLIMQFVVAWNYFKMLFVIAERYVLLGVFSYTAPLAFATGGSKSTNNILASWSKMFGGQVVLIILNAWCMKMFLSGYGNMMASSYGFTKFFVATLCLVGFCKITFKLDSYMASLGVNLGRPSPGMGAMGLIMTASRIISQIGKGGSGEGNSSTQTSTDGGGTSSESTMTSGFTGPIPMTGGENFSAPMDMPEEFSKEDFGESSDASDSMQEQEDFSYSKDKSAGSSVLEELGAVTTVATSGSDTGMRTDTGTGIGRSAGDTKDSSSYGNIGEAADGTKMGDFDEETPMDMNFSNIPDYEQDAGMEAGNEMQDNLAAGDRGLSESTLESENGISAYETSDGMTDMGMEVGNGMQDDLEAGDRGLSESTLESENGISAYETSDEIAVMGMEVGSENGGMIYGAGDYPVERKSPDDADAYDMDLDGNQIENVGSVSDVEGTSYGSAGDAYGNSTLASRSRTAAGKGVDLQQSDVSDLMENSGGLEESEGIINDVSSEYGAGGIGAYQAGKASAIKEAAEKGSRKALENDTVQSPISEMTSGAVDSLQQNAGAGSDIVDEIPQASDSLQEDTPPEMNEPMETMTGKMEHLDAGGSIPSGMHRARGNRTYSHEFHEVPRTRAELRQRQQEIKNQKPIDRYE